MFQTTTNIEHTQFPGILAIMATVVVMTSYSLQVFF